MELGGVLQNEQDLRAFEVVVYELNGGVVRTLGLDGAEGSHLGYYYYLNFCTFNLCQLMSVLIKC